MDIQGFREEVDEERLQNGTMMSHSDAVPLVIYTIGHSNILASSLVALLQNYNIQMVVDVRSSPYSQYSPQYNREKLERVLKESGIKYSYAGDRLGGRPKDPTCYKTQTLPDGKADYTRLVDYPAVMAKEWFLQGIQWLIEMAKNNRLAIMCSEEDPARCHRHHLIGKKLSEVGVDVLHIRGDGNTILDKQLPDLHDETAGSQLPLL